MPFVASAWRATSLYTIAYSTIAHSGIAYTAVARTPAPKASRFCRLPSIVYREELPMSFVASARRANLLYAIAYSAIAHAGIVYNAVAHKPAQKPILGSRERGVRIDRVGRRRRRCAPRRAAICDSERRAR
jgi:hypothetical protein